MPIKRKPIITLLIIVLVVSFAFLFLRSTTTEEKALPSLEKELTRGDPPPSEPPVGTGGYIPAENYKTLEEVFTTYSNEALEEALEADKRVLLFFSASWCPTCSGAKRDLAKNFTQLPNDLLILEIDYDTAKELKIKYNVVIQHTFVQIDKEQNLVTTWNGGGVGAILDNLE